jgi:hypothetical protein
MASKMKACIDRMDGQQDGSLHRKDGWPATRRKVEQMGWMASKMKVCIDRMDGQQDERIRTGTGAPSEQAVEAPSEMNKGRMTYFDSLLDFSSELSVS